jgi:hypothetical protein
VSQQHTRRTLAVLAGVLSMITLGACTSFLNPQFLDTVGLTQSAAALPGEAPTLLVEFENRIGRTVEVRLTWRDADENITERIRVLEPGEKFAEAVICPVSEITVGDVGNLSQTGAVVRLGGGGGDDPIVEVEPFGALLQDGIHYDCGDAVTFSVQSSGRTPSGYQLFATIRRFGG